MFSFFSTLDKQTRKTLTACFLAFFFNGIMTLMMGSILPDMKTAYHLTDTQSGLMLSGHSAGNLVASFVGGLLPLWLGRRKSIVVLSSAAVLGFAMMLLSGNPVWLVIAFVFTGTGRGSITNFNNGTVTRVTNGNPSASNLLHSFFAVGAISAPLVFLLADRVAGWQAAVLTIVALGILVSLMFFRLHFADDRVSREDSAQKSMVFLRNRSFWVFAGMMFFYLCAEYSINGWLVTYLQNKPTLLAQFGTDAQAGLVTYSQTMATLFWVVMLLGRLFSALMAHKHPQKKLMMLDSIGVVLFFTLLLFSNSLLTITLSVTGLGFCMAGICPMIYSDASSITNVYPLGTSMLLAVGSVGAIIMPTLVGVVADAYGFAGGMTSILFGVLALLVLSVLNVVLPPTLPKEKPAANPSER